MDEPETSSRKRERHWLRALRPLLWWFILVLFLFAVHTHQRLCELTRIKFTVYLEGKPVGDEASVSLDGLRLTSGDRIPLGHHRFAVSLPKAEPVSTNLFIFYGEHDMGDIDLKRVRGVLTLQVQPPARRLSVIGPEFSVIMTNSAGVTSSIPTDVYRVDAHWANHTEAKQVIVNAGPVNSLRLAPSLGAVALESNPSGAIVTGNDGRVLGMTPFVLPESSPGPWKGELRLDGYIPVPVLLLITEGETNSFRTNLVNWQYAQAIESAKSYLAAGDADRTLEALSAALRAKPNDPDAMDLQVKATALQKQTTVANHLRRAKEMIASKNYTGARLEADAVIEIMPSNKEAGALINDIATRETEEIKQAEDRKEAGRQKQLTFSKQVFDVVLQKFPEAPLFESHETQAALPASDVEANVMRVLALPAAFKWEKTASPPQSFALVAWQEVPGGLRRAVITGMQIGDKETHVFFKVMEYKKKTSVSYQGQLTFNTSFVPLDPSRMDELSEREKAQIKEGEAMVEERMRRAVGGKSP
jgi:hypothetical protein